MEGQAQMWELCSKVSGHHLLLCHWVCERALTRVRHRVDRVLGPAGPGPRLRVSDDEAEVEDRGDSLTSHQGGVDLSSEEEAGEGCQWKGH